VLGRHEAEISHEFAWVRESAQIAEFSDDRERGDEINTSKRHQAFNHWQPPPGLGMSTQRLCEALDEFGGKPYRHPVFGEDNMLGRILKFDL
jgi:hypothetical protein